MRLARTGLAATTCALGACAGLSGPDGPAAYAIDPAHTSVTFEAAHFGTSTHRWRFERTQGTVEIDRTGTAGRVDIRVATASISTGVPALDSRLRGPEFLDSETYPDATFVAEGFTFSGGKLGAVAGSLTLRGKTLPLTLSASHFNCYLSPLFVRQVCGGDFETTLQRSLWGMDFGLDLGLPDRIRLLVQVEAIRE